MCDREARQRTCVLHGWLTRRRRRMMIRETPDKKWAVSCGRALTAIQTRQRPSFSSGGLDEKRIVDKKGGERGRRTRGGVLCQQERVWPTCAFWIRGYRHLRRQNSELCRLHNILVPLPAFLLSPSPSQAQIRARPTFLVSHYISSVLCNHSPSAFHIFRRTIPGQPLPSILSVASQRLPLS